MSIKGWTKMKKLVIFIGLLIIVFSFSGCTIGKLDEIPPKAIDGEYIEESVSKGTELGNLTSNYFWDVLGVFDIERKSGGEIGKEIGEKIPSGGELGKEIGEKVPNSSEVADIINENTPTEQEIKEEIWSTSDYLKSVIGEVFTNLGEELSDAVDNDKAKPKTSTEPLEEEKTEEVEIQDVEYERKTGTGEFD